ncbi:hypothetical protein [Clostridium fallax]|uniref:Uncharacterized protein n=1 Tax=Clostridium fallax TaxID=1533 RepID=A0A1M4V064_9CLOT|nr:hypothetical protein [Clostridium fallax]SHE62309.1 hypothetical protein SAMN05443638_10680 [Clostridium fallax]SQB06613.1 Uncharacterised protein [Clostridium fallax]
MHKKANLFLTLAILVGFYIIYGVISIIKNIGKYSVSDYIVVSILYILLVLVNILFFKKYKKYSSAEYIKQEEKKRQEKNIQKEQIKKKLTKKVNNNPYMNEDGYSSIDSGQLIIIQTNDFIYKPNEKCYYASNGTRLITKNETVGYTGKSSGITLRIAKGLSYRTGGGRSRPIKGNVNYFFDGSLFITNQRIIFISPKNGFEIPLNKITAIQIAKDGLNFQVNGKNYLLILEKQEYPYTIINILIKENRSSGTLK